MLWPDGKLPENWDNFAELVRAGIRGVDAGRGNEPRPKIMVQIEKVGDLEATRYFFDNLFARGVDCDVLGQSYYPWWHGSLLEMREVLHFMAREYKKDIILVEVAYCWRPTEYRDQPAPFPESPEGQRDFLAAVQACCGCLPMAAAPASSGGSRPCRVRRRRLRSRGMFDGRGNALPVITVFDQQPALTGPEPRRARRCPNFRWVTGSSRLHRIDHLDASLTTMLGEDAGVVGHRRA
jgi:arabinogalactan endo-1,4-beta-galactosidase